jgi:hypothetical protein
MFVFLNSYAYFVFDSIIEYYYNTNDFLLNLHHVVVVAATYMTIRNKSSGFEYLCKSIYLLTFIYIVGMICAEASNPFLVVRTTLRIIGQKNTALYAKNEYLFAAVFILIRVILCPYILIAIYESPSTTYTGKLSCSLVLFVSLLWAYKIFRGIFEKIKKAYEEKGAKMPPTLQRLYKYVQFINGKGTLTRVFHVFVFMVVIIVP